MGVVLGAGEGKDGYCLKKNPPGRRIFEIIKRWTMSTLNRGLALNQLGIIFGERLERHLHT